MGGEEGGGICSAGSTLIDRSTCGKCVTEHWEAEEAGIWLCSLIFSAEAHWDPPMLSWWHCHCPSAV